MGAASTNRLIADRRSSGVRAKWQRKFIAQREIAQTIEADITERTDAKIAALKTQLVTAQVGEMEFRRRLSEFVRHHPAAAEIAELKERGYFARLWWALGFARTAQMNFERARSPRCDAF